MSTSHKHMSQIYTQDYFENGVNSGLSLYENYRWLPHLTIPMAASIAQKLGFNSTTTVLGHGCAKGYLVKAFRYLGFEASGFDISDYAISNSDEEVKSFLFSEKKKLYENAYDCHIQRCPRTCSLRRINNVVDSIQNISRQSLIIVPLSSAHAKPHVVPEYELDKTHIIREPVDWWVSLFTSHGFEINSLSYSMDGVKSSWFSKYPTANLFMTLSS